jgi:protein gp37
MARRLKAMGREEYQDVVTDEGHWTNRITTIGGRLHEPLKLRKPRVIAVNLMGDLFHEDVPVNHIFGAMWTMTLTPQHRYIILTKRPDRAAALLPNISKPMPHVWIGTSAGNQEGANARRDAMDQISAQGWNTWVSSEPRIGPVDWSGWEFLKFMATGGESGHHARPMDPQWPRMDRGWASYNGIPWMFKQWGEWVPLDHLNWVTDETRFKFQPMDVHGTTMVRVGKHLAGHVLDGEEWRELPWKI